MRDMSFCTTLVRILASLNTQNTLFIFFHIRTVYLCFLQIKNSNWEIHELTCMVDVGFPVVLIQVFLFC